MKVLKKELTLEKGLEREWILTNGIGGYSSSTILGANTRKYHGLLVAALVPPARRYLTLSKLDESICIDEQDYQLFTNVCDAYISNGYKVQKSFEKDEIVTFEYEVEGVKIQKKICMEYGKNTVCILYNIKTANKNCKLTLAPIINFRDFHTLNEEEIKVKQTIKDAKIKVTVNDNIETPIYMNLSEGNYIEHHDDTFKNMCYIEEEKRGFYFKENHNVIGRYEVEIQAKENKEITFVCSLEENIEEIDANKVIDNEKKRIDKIVKDSKLKDYKDYVMATDNFIVYRPSFKLHTIIAGYPWFLDWGRDALISFEGLLLKTKRYEIAKEVLMTFVRDIKYGLVPNGYSGFDNRPLYNSVDSSLLLFEQIYKYIQYTKDYDFVKDKVYSSLKKIVAAYKKGINVDDNNIYLDKDFLLVSGTEKTQNTWMDAKIGDIAVTPRNGKVVEVNAMLYNSLKILEELAKKFKDTKTEKECTELSEKMKVAFNESFYNEKKKSLYDVLGDDKIRPNQLFALSLTFPVIEPSSNIAEEMIKTTETKLLNNYGLKSLAKGENRYIDVYEGDGFKRDMSYHQGITWTWLIGLYTDSLKNMIKYAKTKTKKAELEKKYEEVKNKIKTTFEKELYARGMIGNISELYDSKTPYSPKGAPAQAWSVSEILRIIS